MNHRDTETLREAKSTRNRKFQRSVHISRDLLRHIDAIQELSGASFNRIVTTALLRYLFRPEKPTEQAWMQYAVRLDKSMITLADIRGVCEGRPS